MIANHLITDVQSVKLDKGILNSIHANGFAKLLGITDHIQHIVPNLEGKAEIAGKVCRGLHLFIGTVARQDTQCTDGRNSLSYSRTGQNPH